MMPNSSATWREKNEPIRRRQTTPRRALWAARVSKDKVLKLLETVYEYEFKDRRTGVYDALRKFSNNVNEVHQRMAERYSQYIENPVKLIDILDSVIKKLSGQCQAKATIDQTLQLTEITKAIARLKDSGAKIPMN